MDSKKREFLKMMSAAGLGVAATTGLTSCGQHQTTGQQDIDISDRILKDGVINVGYIIYPPFLVRDPNTGELSGLNYDLLTTMAKNLGVKINWAEEVSFGTALTGLELHRYDMATHVWPNAGRVKVADFLNPYSYSAVSAYVRPDKAHLFRKLDDLNTPAVTITTVDGEMGSFIAAKHFSKARSLSLPQNSDMSMAALNVVNGKADASFFETSVANVYLAKNPGALVSLDMVGVGPAQVFPNSFPVARHQGGLKALLNGVLDELINDGTIEGLINQYKDLPRELLSLAKPYQTAHA